MWNKHFALPTVISKLRSIKEGVFMSDRDIGEMFLIFILVKEVRPYYGVDITHTRSEYHMEWEGNMGSKWDIRERKIMGLMVSPYHPWQTVLISRGVALGDRKRKYDPFRRFEVVLNLPRYPGY